ncbi:MAG: uroporphyrinogen-III C-methyltransferase [Planctomycetes bacterium]|nr:uroporphyrinogen-III C-methyltransferase [Planctomycetota bacterium]
MRDGAGKVTIVGAGPGDPGLITLRGFAVLSRAEVVFYDYLVNPIILRQAGLLGRGRTDAKLVCLGRHGEGRILSQTEINEQMVTAAKAGKNVVRLKGGDPAIFGRTAEEIAALEDAGIRYEVVPGVTAALAAGSVAGIPLTHREWASSVAFVTGKECCDKDGKSLDLASLARFPGTLVFYMGVTTAPEWSAELVGHGKPADTPVAIVRRCTLPGQAILKTTLGELPTVLAPEKLRPPAIVIVGEVVRVQADADCLTVRQLFGRTVLVTRPERQSTDMIMLLGELGAAALMQPAIVIDPPADWSAVDAAIGALSTYDWLVFSSANGVHFFLERIMETGGDLRLLGGCQLAAIGPATAEALADYRLRADLLPDEYRAEALAEGLAASAAGQRVLLLRASRGREVLAERLTAAGAHVEQVVVYQSNDVAAPEPDIAAALAEGRIDWVTVTSSAIARSVVRLFGDDLKRSRLAAISPLTAEVLTEAGFPPTVVATEYTTDGLIGAILEAEQSK